MAESGKSKAARSPSARGPGPKFGCAEGGVWHPRKMTAPSGPTGPRTAALKRRALELGFDKIGVAAVEPVDPEGRLRRWLDRGWHAGLGYMAENVAEREDVRRLVPGARSVVVLAHSYHQPHYAPRPPLKVSRYAVGDDYHSVIRRKVRKLRRFLIAQAPEAGVKPTVDTSPVLERAWAAKAGVAWIGKSTMALAPDLGTYFFLATLITDLELDADAPLPDRCGSCTRCLDACPTDAFPEPRVLDARKCITTWNVERRDVAQEDLPDLHGWIAGCDVCQEVCPWNKFAVPTREPRFAVRTALAEPGRVHGPAAWTEAVRGTALQRTGGEALDRNVRKVYSEMIRQDPHGSGKE